MTTTLPFGSWPSPLDAHEVTRGAPRIDGARFVADRIWWSESLPAERGRTAILSVPGTRPGDEPEVVLPAPWSARSRVHEYGGGAWAALGDDLVFVEHSDQRIYRLSPDAGAAPRALTPAGDGLRFADLTIAGGRLLAVSERHGEARVPERAIMEVPLDGSAAEDSGRLVVLAAGHDFFAAPALSPRGDRLAFIAWSHPSMPWDATTLVVAEGGTERVLAGGPGESVLQPAWIDDDTLLYTTDSSGRWQLVRHDVGSGEATVLTHGDADTGGPLWNLGARWFTPTGPGRIVAARTQGRDELIVIDDEGARPLATPLSAQILVRDADGDRLLVTGAGAEVPAGLWLVDASAGASAPVRVRGGDLGRNPAWYPRARELTVEGPHGPVHAFVYPPTNPGVAAPEDERPPYVVTVHGGPTAHVAGEASPAVAYFTSRGIGVLDVNYGGSSGYGRAYRERLLGQWGVVDVDDVVAAARGLAEAGLADPDRLAIKGGSAGGWTVLSALTTSDAFSAGISRYGVADLRALAADTHDFEARYLDGLVGPLPEAESVYIERSPLSRTDRLTAPVLLLQGADDPVVPPAQSEAVRDALAARGIPHALVVFEGESHGFRRAETIVTALESELSFLGQVFGFETPGVPTLPLH
ncbi:prolyl oligopeptidase family serine peptidase [Microbacterium limosum]|uniref:Prolyl oligopeptidase family serine peptidase n=1 Tax=Microbacterium limosum TaxID=3079935 RepID=A0AAU0MJA7_9MICO|nr:prolyl oligopeptidase family serine peptidase [Microbacterium sp. Y20]WOQ70336.1 prolyl oligopeptidase family serine peptidase [Microbacterium sp. Y20]